MDAEPLDAQPGPTTVQAYDAHAFGVQAQAHRPSVFINAPDLERLALATPDGDSPLSLLALAIAVGVFVGRIFGK